VIYDTQPHMRGGCVSIVAENQSDESRRTVATHVDINIILVGNERFTAADHQQVLDSIKIASTIYQQVSFDIGTVNRFIIAIAQAKGHELISSSSEAKALTDDWSVDNAAVDVFVVRRMVGADGWSAVGGSCDKDKKGQMTGAVVSLNGNSANSGNTFAHEIGHYLGLPHVATAGNFIGNNGSSNSNTAITAAQGTVMKKHCAVQP
jgi:hypothetical protein